PVHGRAHGGPGVLVYADKRRVEGNFLNNKPYGECVVYMPPDGEPIEMEFDEHGEPI
ncbi:unnamed protein product, partial [Heterosigma akashiwo]